MDNNIYDIDKLKQQEIDVESAVGHFDGYQQYFDRLNMFAEVSKQYLRAYTPMVVVCSEDIRKDFFAEIEKIRNMLDSLGVSCSTPILRDLEDAVHHGSAKTLSDGLLVFHSEMDLIAKKIASARVDDAVSLRDAGQPLILVVDDKPELLTTIANMLDNQFTVIAVTSGRAALKALEKHTPVFFLLDIEMPQMDGYELAAEIRKDARFAKTPIVFLTAKNTREHVITAIQHGVNDYIIKPVRKDLLLDKIERLLE